MPTIVASTNGYTNTAQTYGLWNIMVAQSTSATTNTIWSGWVGQNATTTIGAMPSQPAISNEQYQRQLEEAQAAQVKALHERTKAMTRAQKLLEGHLTPTQLATLRRHNWFIVKGGRSKLEYAIHATGIAGNIIELKKRRAAVRLCCHADQGAIPQPDHWLTQKLWIEYCEDDFKKAANRSPVSDFAYDEAA